VNQLWKIIDFYFRVLYQMTWRVLDLFSGTDSVKKACVGLSFFGEVISLDLAKADINIDIMEWDYKQYPPGYFHVVWASPCCTCFSNLQRCNIGRFGITAESNEADISNIGLPMLRRTEEIIKYFKPKFYFIENPQTARTKDYVALNPGDFFDVDYCMYGKPFRKRTRIWTNLKSFEPLLCDKNCGSFDGKKHIQQVNSKGGGSNQTITGNRTFRSEVPVPLIRSLFYGVIRAAI